MNMHGNMRCCTASLGLWMTLVLHGVALHLHMTWLQVEWWVWKFGISKEPVFWNVFGFHPWNWSRIDVATYMFLAKTEAPLAVCSKQCIQRLEWLLGSRTAKSFNAFPVFHLLKPAFDCHSFEGRLHWCPASIGCETPGKPQNRWNQNRMDSRAAWNALCSFISH